jgi:hypothetical protein
VAVLGFSRGWPGDIVLDGPGTTLHLQLALDHLQHGGGVPYWTAEMWSGTPSWALAPSFPVFALLPAAILIGVEGAVKAAILFSQIIGGWGTFVLAQSLWGRRALRIPFAAALIYALHPLFISHGVLFGHATSVFVMATTPWLVWGIRKALQGGGARYAVLAGLLAALTLLEHAEHAYALVPIGVCQAAVELWRARGRTPADTVRRLSRQFLVMIGVAVGAAAFWLLPFMALGKSFILTPPDLARLELVQGHGAQLGREPGTFLTRAEPITETVTFDQSLFRGNFYLGWVAVLPTMVTVLLLGRHDRDGHLTAVLVAGGIDLWLSTAGVPLADSGPAQRLQPVPFIVVGVFTGVLIGSFIRRVASGRAAVFWGAVTALVLVSVPYIAPLIALREIVPGLSSIRFPRFYPLAALSVALGAVYPLRFVHGWAARRRPDLATLFTTAVALAVAAAFLVDIHPYRSFYRVDGPDDRAAYAQARRSLEAVGSDFRVATPHFGDPRQVQSLLGTGFDLSVGWPHPTASKQVWRLTAEPLIAPEGYRQVALGLSSTAYVATEHTTTGTASGELLGVQLERNPRAQPIARAYGEALVVRDASIAAELAVGMAPRNISVVNGGTREAEALESLTPARLTGTDECAQARHEGELAAAVTTACALHGWVGVFAPFDFVGAAGGNGAVFRPAADGLNGVAVWLDRFPGALKLVVRDVGEDGALGAELTQATWDKELDPNGMFAFRFPAIENSGGRRLAFVFECANCEAGGEPRLLATTQPRGTGTLVEADRQYTDRGVAFAPLYDVPPAAEALDTTITTTKVASGRWRLDVSGARPALVVLAESWFPGWTAKVDGRAAPVLQADAAFLGVPVGAGAHRIELTYNLPSAAKVGRLVSAGTLLTLLAAAPVSRQWARRHRHGVRARSGRRRGLGDGGPAVPSDAG